MYALVLMLALLLSGGALADRLPAVGSTLGSGLANPSGQLTFSTDATRSLGLEYTVKPGQSIQTALTAAAANGGGTVFVQAGTYPITTTIFISSNTHLKCEFGAKFVFADAGWTGAEVGSVKIPFVNGDWSEAAMEADTDNAVRSQNIEVSGCSFRSTSQNFHGILFRQADHIRIHGNFFKNVGSGTAMLASTATDVYDNKFGVLAVGNTHTSTTIDGLTTTANVEIGDFIYGPGITDGTTVTAIPTASSVTLSAATSSTVSGATIGFGAAHNACWDHWEGPAHLSVRNNFCVSSLYGTLVSGSSTFGSRVLVGHDGLISGNSYAMVGDRGMLGIWIQGLNVVGNGSSRIKAIGNSVTGDGVNQNECWRVQGASVGNIISNNHCVASGPTVAEVSDDVGGTPADTVFHHNTYTGIVLPASNSAIDAGGIRTIVDGEVVVGGNYAYAIRGNGTNVVLKNNRVDPGTTGSYQLTAGSTILIDPAPGLRLGGALTTAGAFATTLTSTATTNATLPAGTTSLAPLASPSFTTPILGAASATSLNIGAGALGTGVLFHEKGSTSNLAIARIQENSGNTATDGGAHLDLYGTRSDGTDGVYASLRGLRLNNAGNDDGYFDIWTSSSGGTALTRKVRISENGLTEFTGAISVPTSTPASASAAGVAGTIAWDANFIYICTATNTWKRVAIATW